MKNSLMDLNDHLFAQMERLSDEDLKGEDLQLELERTKAVTAVSKSIVENARLALDAQVAVGNSIASTVLPKMLENKS